MAVLAGLAVLTTAALLQPARSTEAFNTELCAYGTSLYFLRFAGNGASFDTTHGNFPDWWQEEIEEGGDIWNDDGGADFNFFHHASSSHDWTKLHRPRITRIAETGILDTACRITDVDTWFNTRYTWNRCDTDPGDCNQADTYDVKAVAVHEFGHWLFLDHTQWWRYSCVMRNGEAEDRTLCGDDRNGIQWLYGED